MKNEVTDEHKDNAKLKSSATTQLVSQIILSNGTTLSYGYDAEERITSVVETYTVNGQTVTNTTLYTYDALGQLLEEKVNGTVVNTMTYDNYGNIRAKNGVVYTYGDAVWKDLLTGYGNQTITYDAQGNPTSYLGHTLTWGKGRQLKSFDSNTYTYNANGIRTSKTVGGVKHTYTLDGTKILREAWGDNTLIPLYDNEDGVCGILYNDVPYYFIKNLQGDVIAIVDKDAETVAKYAYDAWGVCTITQDTTDCNIATINPFRYRSYYYDEEIDMYYLQSRYYDSEIGRWLNADAAETVFAIICGVIVSQNLVCYCFDNPVNMIDDQGMFGTPIQWAMSIIGGLVGWYFGDYVARKLGYSGGWKYWAIRSGVVIGGTVIGWFAASAMTAIVKSFLLATPGALLRLPSWVINFFGLQSAYRTIVIGETMTRVISYANTIGASVYQGLGYYDKVERIFGARLARIIGGVHNALWIIKKMIEKYRIVDIGIDITRATRSPYYLMETILTFFYKYKTLVIDYLN